MCHSTRCAPSARTPRTPRGAPALPPFLGAARVPIHTPRACRSHAAAPTRRTCLSALGLGAARALTHTRHAHRTHAAAPTRRTCPSAFLTRCTCAIPHTAHLPHARRRSHATHVPFRLWLRHATSPPHARRCPHRRGARAHPPSEALHVRHSTRGSPTAHTLPPPTRRTCRSAFLRRCIHPHTADLPQARRLLHAAHVPFRRELRRCTCAHAHCTPAARTPLPPRGAVPICTS